VEEEGAFWALREGHFVWRTPIIVQTMTSISRDFSNDARRYLPVNVCMLTRGWFRRRTCFRSVITALLMARIGTFRRSRLVVSVAIFGLNGGLGLSTVSAVITDASDHGAADTVSTVCAKQSASLLHPIIFVTHTAINMMFYGWPTTGELEAGRSRPLLAHRSVVVED
jgi:hypothetical protein